MEFQTKNLKSNVRMIVEIKQDMNKCLNEFQENSAEWNKKDNTEHGRGIQ
jgi:hypothetical protein